MSYQIRIKLTKTVWIWLTVIVLLGSSAGAALLYFGSYNVSALTGHTDLVYRFLEYARIRAVKVRTPNRHPDLEQQDWRNSGIKIYENHCLKCHGAPGLGPEPFALGMMPPPSAIVRVARDRTPEELYWVIENGIKMSGMPAWKYRLTENQIWDLVALLKKITLFTAEEYSQLRLGVTTDPTSKKQFAKISATASHLYDGKIALQQYNCSSCHVIDGMPSAAYFVGPPLSDVVNRSFIAGILPMSRENLVQWIMDPKKFKPATTMPNLNVTRKHAELMVDYLSGIVSKD